MYRGFVLAAVASGLSPGLRPFAACHPPLSPFPVISEAVLSIKLYKGWKKKWNNAKSLLFLFTPFAFSKRLDKMAVGCCSCVEVFYTVCQVSRWQHIHLVMAAEICLRARGEEWSFTADDNSIWHTWMHWEHGIQTVMNHSASATRFGISWIRGQLIISSTGTWASM